jgi:hypothetical protein
MLAQPARTAPVVSALAIGQQKSRNFEYGVAVYKNLSPRYATTYCQALLPTLHNTLAEENINTFRPDSLLAVQNYYHKTG